MPTKLFWDKNAKELKTKLDSIIEVENEDTLKTHFRQTILFKDNGKVSGTINQDNFKIWTHETKTDEVQQVFSILSYRTWTIQTFKSRA